MNAMFNLHSNSKIGPSGYGDAAFINYVDILPKRRRAYRASLAALTVTRSVRRGPLEFCSCFDGSQTYQSASALKRWVDGVFLALMSCWNFSKRLSLARDPNLPRLRIGA